jgi:hypothetical protein
LVPGRDPAESGADHCRRGVKPDGLSSELTQKIPQLADYSYAKMKDQILLVNAVIGKIADVIPETQPQTTD